MYLFTDVVKFKTTLVKLKARLVFDGHNFYAELQFDGLALFEFIFCHKIRRIVGHFM